MCMAFRKGDASERLAQFRKSGGIGDVESGDCGNYFADQERPGDFAKNDDPKLEQSIGRWKKTDDFEA